MVVCCWFSGQQSSRKKRTKQKKKKNPVLISSTLTFKNSRNHKGKKEQRKSLKTTPSCHRAAPQLLSLKRRPAARADEKWICCSGAGANAACISSDGTFGLMHYARGGQLPCNFQ